MLQNYLRSEDLELIHPWQKLRTKMETYIEQRICSVTHWLYLSKSHNVERASERAVRCICNVTFLTHLSVLQLSSFLLKCSTEGYGFKKCLSIEFVCHHIIQAKDGLSFSMGRLHRCYLARLGWNIPPSLTWVSL